MMSPAPTPLFGLNHKTSDQVTITEKKTCLLMSTGPILKTVKLDIVLHELRIKSCLESKS